MSKISGGNSGSHATHEARSDLRPSGFDPGRAADLQLALDYALRVLTRFEPPDARAMSNEFVSMASIAADLANEECREILRAAIERDEKDMEAIYGN